VRYTIRQPDTGFSIHHSRSSFLEELMTNHVPLLLERQNELLSRIRQRRLMGCAHGWNRKLHKGASLPVAPHSKKPFPLWYTFSEVTVRNTNGHANDRDVDLVENG